MVDTLDLALSGLPELIESSQFDALLPIAEALDRMVSQWLDRIGADKAKLFITYSTEDYEPGLRILLRSLRTVSDVPVLVLRTGEWTFEHEARHVAVVTVPVILKTDLREVQGAAHWWLTITKLWAFSISGVGRIAFLDADCLVLREIDELFEGNGLAAVPDFFSASGIAFNSGVFSFSPSRDLCRRVLAAIPTTDSNSGGEQGLLNAVFTEWRRLPIEYNFLRTYGLIYGPFRDRRIRILHYVSNKPWKLRNQTMTDIALRPFDELWTAQLSDEEYNALIKDWRERLDEFERNYHVHTARGLHEHLRSEVVHAQQVVLDDLRQTRRRLYALILGTAILTAIGTLILVKLTLL